MDIDSFRLDDSLNIGISVDLSGRGPFYKSSLRNNKIAIYLL